MSLCKFTTADMGVMGKKNETSVSRSYDARVCVGSSDVSSYQHVYKIEQIVGQIK